MSGKHNGLLGEEELPSGSREGYIPLYLEGSTIIGKVWIRGKYIAMEIEDENVLKLMGENLIGLSTVSMGNRPDPFIEEITIKEKTDER